jgi:hypothetical protein
LNLPNTISTTHSKIKRRTISLTGLSETSTELAENPTLQAQKGYFL